MSKPETSKRAIKVAAILVVVIVVVIAGAWFPNYFPGRPSATSDKIEVVACEGYGPEPLTTGIVAVRNVGSGVVEITAIYVGSDLYSYSPSVAPGKFSAASNQIAPGQTVAFTVTIASGSWSTSAVYAVRAVTKNGAEASGTC